MENRLVRVKYELEDLDRNRRYNLNGLGGNKALSIGRDEKCDIRFQKDFTVSKMHGGLFSYFGQVYIFDMSHNGTYVGGGFKRLESVMNSVEYFEFLNERKINSKEIERNFEREKKRILGRYFNCKENRKEDLIFYLNEDHFKLKPLLIESGLAYELTPGENLLLGRIRLRFIEDN